MENQETLPLGVVLERRRSNHPWKDFAWKPVAVIPGAPALDPLGEWKLLKDGDGWSHYHCGTLPLELFRSETEGYKLSLSQEPPCVYVVLRSGEDMESRHEVVPFLVTACPHEAQDYLDSGEEIVEGVPMPPDLIAFVQAYVDQHHVDVPFRKRKRTRHDPDRRPAGPQAPAGPRRGNRHG